MSNAGLPSDILVHSSFRPVSRTDEVRLGPILALPEVLTELNVQPSLAFKAAGVDIDCFLHADNRMSIQKLGRLFHCCARLTSCEHFGLLVGMRFKLRDLGPLGTLLKHSPTIGAALSELIQHLHWHDRAAAPVLIETGSEQVLLGYSVYHHGIRGGAHIHDAAIAVAYRILEELYGSGWRPMWVQLARREPGDPGAYQRLFRAPVHFNANVSGVEFAADDLLRRIDGADAVLRAIMQDMLAEVEEHQQTPFRQRVEAVLHQMIWVGECSLDRVARTLRIHERTLRRRLTEEGVSFRQLVIDTRCRIAAQLLENSNRTISDISAALNYQDPTAFTRTFTIWAGVCPREWRNQHQVS